MRLDDFLKRQGGSEKRKRMVVCAAADKVVLDSVYDALGRGLMDAVLVGDKDKIVRICNESGYDAGLCEIVDRKEDKQAAETAVEIVKKGEAQVLMKGNIHTAMLMHAILNKVTGIRESDILSSVTVIDSPAADRLIFLSDPGIVPYPTFPQKVGIINNAVKIARAVGVELPKVAVLAAEEGVNPVMPPTMEAAALAIMSQRGQIKNCIVDGPLGLDVAINENAARIKGVQSPASVAGHADIVVVPNVEMGNGIMKAVRFLGSCTTAGVLAGASVPVVMTSRADFAENKLRSMGFALATAGKDW